MQLTWLIVGKVDVLVEAGLESGVGCDEALHRFGVACNYDNQLVPVVLHGLEQCLYGLASEVVFAAGGQGIGLIYEQHAAEGALYDLAGLYGGLAHVSRHQPGAVDFDELALFQRANSGVEPAEETGDSCFASTGVAGENHVHAHGGGRQPGPPASASAL